MVVMVVVAVHLPARQRAVPPVQPAAHQRAVLARVVHLALVPAVHRLVLPAHRVDQAALAHRLALVVALVVRQVALVRVQAAVVQIVQLIHNARLARYSGLILFRWAQHRARVVAPVIFVLISLVVRRHHRHVSMGFPVIHVVVFRSV